MGDNDSCMWFYTGIYACRNKINFYCINISYLVDQCICPACSQTFEKTSGSVVFIRQVSPQHPAALMRMRSHAHFLFLIGAIVFLLQSFQKKIFWILLVLFYCSSLHLWIELLSLVISVDRCSPIRCELNLSK